MKKNYFLVSVLTFLLVLATTIYTNGMQNGTVSIIGRIQASLFNLDLIQEIIPKVSSEEKVDQVPQAATIEPGQAVTAFQNCSFSQPVIPQYNAEFLGVTQKSTEIHKNNLFQTTVSIKNTGNMPWFSQDSNCINVPVVNLGTSKDRDRASIFFTESNDYPTGWNANNRIKMDQNRVDPGEVAYFKFWSNAPDQDDIFVEYFAPVVEGVSWIDEATAKVVIRVGDYNPEDEQQKNKYAFVSRRLSDFNVSGEKKILVDVSDQIMHLKIGDETIKTFPVSTGAYRTPTPYGTTTIKFKQDVRVGSKWPHYVMPRFMWFRKGGYGIHSLPSLRNDGGTYWREARNHIQRRVSHGCIRLLPEDSEVVYGFGEVGTKITVQP